MKQSNLGSQNQPAQPPDKYHLQSPPNPHQLHHNQHPTPNNFTSINNTRKTNSSDDEHPTYNQRLAAMDQPRTQLLNSQEQLCCIEPLCLHPNRIFTSQFSNPHQNHQFITFHAILSKLQALRCNQPLKHANPTKVSSLFQAIDQIYHDIIEFQSQILQILAKIKTQTWQHIAQVKASFDSKQFEQVRNRLANDFSHVNVNAALREIQKYEKLRYPNLDYPYFKAAMLQKRCSQILNSDGKRCLSQLRSWVCKLWGEGSQNANKRYSRSLATFMFKGVSQQSIFSYYLRNDDYWVTHQGKRLKRLQIHTHLPVTVIQKRVDSTPIKIKVLKSCAEGLAIGCGLLPSIQSCGFQNVYSSGYFLQTNGSVISNKSRFKNGFKFGENDIISIRIEQKKIMFNKIREGSAIQGFCVDLQQSRKGFSCDDHFYVAVMLGGIAAQLEILPD